MELRECVCAAAVLLLCVASQVLCQPCQGPCVCPGPVPRCPAGVPLVLDGCRCCQVCAGQPGQACSALSPCDVPRGLRCDYGASFPGGPGECVADEDLSCRFNGVTYREGQSFRPSCDALCRCAGGGVSCVHACPVHGRRPTPDCPHPRLVRLPGKCCEEWVCEDLENTVIQDAITAMGSGRRWDVPPLPAACTPRSTQWTSCSRSCGAGVSTRVSNHNPACRMQMESRLCKVRPCTAAAPRPIAHNGLGQDGECAATFSSPGPVRLVHHGCLSTRALRLRYCGDCGPARCCEPLHATTAQLTFLCPTGRLLRRAVMLVHSCACHGRCAHGPYRNPAPWGFRP